jgi:hypothetical protein
MAWRQELWRRQRTHLAAEKDETHYVCSSPSVVALSYASTAPKTKKKDRQHKKQSHHHHNTSEEEAEQRAENYGDEVTSTPRPRKKRSASFKRAVEKIKHLATMHEDEDEEEAAAEEFTAGRHSPRRPEGARGGQASDPAGVYDLGANQIHAMEWYQRLSAAARPQRAS